MCMVKEINDHPFAIHMNKTITFFGVEIGTQGCTNVDQVKHKLKNDKCVKCVWVIILLHSHELTSARKSIACVSSVARAGVTPLSVVATCIIMADIDAFSAFIHICNSNSKVKDRNKPHSIP